MGWFQSLVTSFWRPAFWLKKLGPNGRVAFGRQGPRDRSTWEQPGEVTFGTAWLPSGKGLWKITMFNGKINYTGGLEHDF